MVRSEIFAFAHLQEFHALLMFDCPVEISEELLDCDHRRGEEMRQQYEMKNATALRHALSNLLLASDVKQRLD